MGENYAGLSTDVFFIAGITVFLCVILHKLYKNIFRNKTVVDSKPESENVSDVHAAETSTEKMVTESKTSTKAKKRATWKGKSEFSHPWLLKNLKGHPGTVLQVDFSANGKFMAATCDETCPMVVDAASATARRRRPCDLRRTPPAPPSQTPPPPPRIPTEELAAALRPHLLSSERMWALGYPLEIEPNSSKAVVYINPPPRFRTPPFTNWDVNAPEFVPGYSPGDSGRGSLGSTPRSDSDEEADAVEHACARCEKTFRMTRDGEFVIEETCLYHWGRMGGANGRYGCCNSIAGANGCTTARFHVWSGTRPGMNGPIDGYVRARSPRGGVYAIDAEMCYTTAGLELASIAVVAADGRLVYRSLVKPNNNIVDYNTRFSGIRPRDMLRATKSLKDVQNDILGFVGTDTILIGHALDNDLRALKLLHSAVIDTCALYPHARGFPLRRSLRDLSEQYLGRIIQKGGIGHSPLEDARATMDLVIQKVHQDREEHTRQVPTSQTWVPMMEPYDPLVFPPF